MPRRRRSTCEAARPAGRDLYWALAFGPEPGETNELELRAAWEVERRRAGEGMARLYWAHWVFEEGLSYAEAAERVLQEFGGRRPPINTNEGEPDGSR